MQSQNRLFEDLSKVATSALGTMAGVGREVDEMVKRRAREFVGGGDAIDPDAFETLKSSVAAAREDILALRAELAALRAEIANPPPRAKTAKS